MNPFLPQKCRLWQRTAIEKEKVSILFFSHEKFSTAFLMKDFMVKPIPPASFPNRVTGVKEV